MGFLKKVNTMTDRALTTLLKTSILIEDMKKQKKEFEKQIKVLDLKIEEAKNRVKGLREVKEEEILFI
jgi:predicted  nucleic acid-binding Zn-ribbon protein